MREYLNFEFRDIAPTLQFEYNLERIIDDFILLAVFVGNDFLPNLPDLHIHQNALERLFELYKKVLPTLGASMSDISLSFSEACVLDGYVNESGTINTERLQRLLDEMTTWEQEVFEKEYDDRSWLRGKQSKHIQHMEASHKQWSQLGWYPFT